MYYSNVLRAVLVGTILLTTEVAWGQCGAITITPSSLANGQQGGVYASTQFTAVGATAPVSFSATGLPTGTTVNTAGLLTGTPSVSGTFAVRITARGANSCLGRRTLSWVIAPGTAPTITSGNSAAFIVGQANSFTVTKTGTPTPTLAIGGDALPSGVTFVPGTGILSGMPASGTGGTYNLTFTATNGVPPPASQNFTLTVNQRPSVSGGPFSLAENSINGTSVGTVTVTDPHTPAQTHTWSITAGNTGGAFAIDSSGQITVNTSSALDFETTPSFTLTVQATDNGTPNLSGSAPITVNLSNVNEGPTATPDSTTVAEGGTVTTLTTPPGATSVRDNDSDPEDLLTTLTVNTTPVTPPSNGTLTLNADGTFSYTHNGSETTTDSFIYQICDPQPLCATATVFITITAGNDAPVLTAGGTLAYTENQAATAIDTTITVADIDDANLEGATVQITGNYQNGQDLLAFTDTATITGTFTAATGLLTLTGSDNLANYQAALRSVTYVNTSDTPNTTNRTVTWVGNDGTTSSAAVTSTITIAAANDPPVLTAGATLAYTEGNPATAVDTTITVVDADDVNLASATVQITGNYQNGADVLAFVNTATITGNFVVATGTLTLTGTDTLANYQAALRSVTYQNTSAAPSIADRTITWIGSDGTDTSAPVTSTITVTAVNGAPVLTAGATLAYTENQVAQVVDGTVTVSDADDTDFEGASVQIFDNYQNGEDVLACGACGSITATFNAGSGKLSMSGSATLAAYQAALRSVTYVNTSDTPNTTNRSVAWSGFDGTTNSALAISTITVTAANDPPVLTAGGTLSYTENEAAKVVNGTVTVTDPDDTDLESATVQITSNYQNGSDVLACPGGCGGIGAVFTPATGTLSLTGTASEAVYQAALRSVTYVNTSENPTTSTRTVTWLGNDGTNTSVAVTSTITVMAVNDAPVLTASGTLGYTENQAATAINTTVTVSDVDSTNLAGATIQITGNYQNGQDVLSFANTASITGSFAAASGTLTLAGTDTLANYQAALRSVRYANSSENPSTTTRTVTWQVNDGGGVNNLSNTPTSTITVTAVNDPPSIASPPSYAVHTNIAMDVADGAGDLLEVGISDVDSAGPFTLASLPGTAAVTGGTLTIAANGSFHYNPGLNLTGAGTFVYQVCDSGTPLPVACTNVTATLNVSGLAIVFVDDSAAAGGNGTLEEPVQTLAAGLTALSSGGGASNVFLFSGSYGQTAVQTLANNVRVFGQGSTVADFETLYAITPPETAPVNSIDRPDLSQARPIVSSTTGCLALALGASNTLRGFEIRSCGGDALASTGANFGTLTVPNDNMVINTSGRALNLTNGTLSATFSSITSTGGANNISLNTVAGTSTLGTGALSGATGAAFSVSGGTATLSYSGTIAQASAGQRAVDVTNHSTGTLTLSGAITASNGTGIGFSNADGVYTLSGVVTLNGGDAGIDVSGGSAGMITLANTGSVITNPSGIAVDIDGSSAGFTFSFAGNITKTNNATTAIDVTNNTNGTISFTGTSKTLSTSTATAVNLATNTGSTIGFSNGGLVITTTSGTGFNATGGAAAINVTGAGNTITAGTGTALNINNSTIGGSGLTFQSISANAATSGIVLNTTGVLGGLTVTGNSSGTCGGSVTVNAVGTPATVTAPVTADCTGGTIQATTGAGISLTNTQNVSLTRMRVLNSGTDGIIANTLNGFTLSNSFISDSSGVAQDRGIEIGDFSTGTAVNGAINITNSTIGPTPHDTLAMGVGSGTSTWNITGTQFNSTGNSGINTELRGTAVFTAFTVDGCVFAGGGAEVSARGVFVNNLDDSVITLATIQDSTFTNNNIAIDMNQQNDTDPVGSHTFRVLDNTITGDSTGVSPSLSSHAINVFAAAGAFGGTFNGRIEGNIIGNSGVAGSGSAIGNGVRVNINGGSDATILLDSNIIRQTPNGRGIEIIGRNGTGGLDVTVTNNNVNPQDTSGFPLAAILVQSNCLTVCNTVRSNVRNNTVPSATDVTDLLTTYIELVESSTSTLELVDSTSPISGTCTSELAATNTGSSGVLGGCVLIAGPISTPP